MFKTMIGNPYDSFEDGDVICVTTNGEIKTDGRAVMGRGSAKFARDTFVGIDSVLASMLKRYGNRVCPLGKYTYKGKMVRILSFPTKHGWRDDSDLELIEKSGVELKLATDRMGFRRVYLPVPGCGNGQLNWSDVEKRLYALDERFVVYSLSKKEFEK